jgi:hypothetical protein
LSLIDNQNHAACLGSLDDPDFEAVSLPHEGLEVLSCPDQGLVGRVRQADGPLSRYGEIATLAL